MFFWYCDLCSLFLSLPLIYICFLFSVHLPLIYIYFLFSVPLPDIHPPFSVWSGLICRWHRTNQPLNLYPQDWPNASNFYSQPQSTDQTSYSQPQQLTLEEEKYPSPEVAHRVDDHCSTNGCHTGWTLCQLSSTPPGLRPQVPGTRPGNWPAGTTVNTWAHLRTNHTFKIILHQFRTQIIKLHVCLIHCYIIKNQPSIYHVGIHTHTCILHSEKHTGHSHTHMHSSFREAHWQNTWFLHICYFHVCS